MAAGFRTRKIKSEQSIGDRLKRARIRRKISVAEVEEATRIRAKFILALESDSWDQIPSEVYGRGYLEAYLEFLKMPVDQIMKEYDRGRTTYARRCQDSQVELMPKSSVRIPKFLLTPRFLLICAVSVGVLGFAGFVAHQFQRLTSAPFLSVRLVTPVQAAEQSEGADLLANVDSVNISGQTDAEATLTINGAVVTVNKDGTYNHPVAVQKGVNAVSVKAKFSNGKETEETRTIIVK